MLKEEKSQLFTIPIMKFNAQALSSPIIGPTNLSAAMWEKADIMNTRKEKLNTSTTFSAWSMSLGTDAAKSESAEPAQATSALLEDNLKETGFDLIVISYPYHINHILQ